MQGIDGSQPPGRRNEDPEQEDTPATKRPRVEHEGRELEATEVVPTQIPSDRGADRQQSSASLMETESVAIPPGSGVMNAPRLRNFGFTCFINASLHWLYRALNGQIPDDLWHIALSPGRAQNMAISLIHVLKHIDKCRCGAGNTSSQSRESTKLLKTFIMSCQDFGLNFQDTVLPLNYLPPENLSSNAFSGVRASPVEMEGFRERMEALVVVPDSRSGMRSVSLYQQDAHEFVITLMYGLGLDPFPGYTVLSQSTETTEIQGARLNRTKAPQRSSFIILPLANSLDEAFKSLNSESQVEPREWDVHEDIQVDSGAELPDFPTGHYPTIISERMWKTPGSEGVMIQIGGFGITGFGSGEGAVFNRERIKQMLNHSLDGVNFPVDSSGATNELLKLTALVCHKGNSLVSGHYVAVERQDDSWYLLDDQNRRVQHFQWLSDIFSQEFTPYLLLYQKAEEGDQLKPLDGAGLLPAHQPASGLELPVEGDREPSPELDPVEPMETEIIPPEEEYGAIPASIEELMANEHYRKFLQGYASYGKGGYSVRANISEKGSVVAQLPIPRLQWLREDVKCWDDKLVGFLCELCGIDYRFKTRYTKAHLASNALMFMNPAGDDYLSMLGRYTTLIWGQKPGLTRLCKALRLDEVKVPDHPAFPEKLRNTTQWDIDSVFNLLELVDADLARSIHRESLPLLTELVDAIESRTEPEALLVRLNKGLDKGVPGMEPPEGEGLRPSPRRWSMAKMFYVIDQNKAEIEQCINEPLPNQWRLRDHDFFTLMPVNHPEYLPRFKIWFSRKISESQRLHDLMRQCNTYRFQLPQVSGFPQAGEKPAWSTGLLYKVANYFSLTLPRESSNYQNYVRDHRNPNTRIDNMIKQLNSRCELDAALRPPVFPGIRPALSWNEALLRVMLQVDPGFSEEDKRNLPEKYQPAPSDYLKVCACSSEYYAENMKAFLEELISNPKKPNLRGMTFSRLLNFLNTPQGYVKPDYLPVPDTQDIDPSFRGIFPWTEDALEHVLLKLSVKKAPNRQGGGAVELCSYKLKAGSNIGVLVTALTRNKADYPDAMKPFLTEEQKKNIYWNNALVRLMIALTQAKTPAEQLALKDSKYRLCKADVEKWCSPEKQQELITQFNLK